MFANHFVPLCKCFKSCILIIYYQSPLNALTVFRRDGASGVAASRVLRGEGDYVLGRRSDGAVQRDQRQGAAGADIGPGDADLRDAAPHRGTHDHEQWVRRKSEITQQF